MDSTILLFPKSEISSFLPASVSVQAGLCRPGGKPKSFVFSCESSVVMHCYVVSIVQGI